MAFGFRGFLLLVFLAAAACSAEVVRDLPEGDANRVVEELVRADVPARKVRTDGRRNLFGVEVPQGSLSRALALISARDVLAPRREGLAAFSRGSSPLTSSAERHVRYFSALAEELERTLETLSGVQRARVHLAMPPLSDAPFSLQPARTGPTRASVLLRVRDREFDLQPEEIQAIVAGAVPDLPRTEVAVVIQPASAATLPPQDLVWIGPLLVSSGWTWGIGIFLALWLALTVWLVISRLSARRPAAGSEDANDEPSPG